MDWVHELVKDVEVVKVPKPVVPRVRKSIIQRHVNSGCNIVTSTPIKQNGLRERHNNTKTPFAKYRLEDSDEDMVSSCFEGTTSKKRMQTVNQINNGRESFVLSTEALDCVIGSFQYKNHNFARTSKKHILQTPNKSKYKSFTKTPPNTNNMKDTIENIQNHNHHSHNPSTSKHNITTRNIANNHDNENIKHGKYKKGYKSNRVDVKNIVSKPKYHKNSAIKMASPTVHKNCETQQAEQEKVETSYLCTEDGMKSFERSHHLWNNSKSRCKNKLKRLKATSMQSSSDEALGCIDRGNVKKLPNKSNIFKPLSKTNIPCISSLNSSSSDDVQNMPPMRDVFNFSKRLKKNKSHKKLRKRSDRSIQRSTIKPQGKNVSTQTVFSDVTSDEEENEVILHTRTDSMHKQKNQIEKYVGRKQRITDTKRLVQTNDSFHHNKNSIRAKTDINISTFGIREDEVQKTVASIGTHKHFTGSFIRTRNQISDEIQTENYCDPVQIDDEQPVIRLRKATSPNVKLHPRRIKRNGASPPKNIIIHSNMLLSLPMNRLYRGQNVMQSKDFDEEQAIEIPEQEQNANATETFNTSSLTSIQSGSSNSNTNAHAAIEKENRNISLYYTRLGDVEERNKLPLPLSTSIKRGKGASKAVSAAYVSLKRNADMEKMICASQNSTRSEEKKKGKQVEVEVIGGLSVNNTDELVFAKPLPKENVTKGGKKRKAASKQEEDSITVRRSRRERKSVKLMPIIIECSRSCLKKIAAQNINVVVPDLKACKDIENSVKKFWRANTKISVSVKASPKKPTPIAGKKRRHPKNEGGTRSNTVEQKARATQEPSSKKMLPQCRNTTRGAQGKDNYSMIVPDFVDPSPSSSSYLEHVVLSKKETRECFNRTRKYRMINQDVGIAPSIAYNNHSQAGRLKITGNGKKSKQFLQDNHMYLVLLKGRCKVTIQDTSQILEVGHDALIPMGTTYSISNDDPNETLDIFYVNVKDANT